MRNLQLIEHNPKLITCADKPPPRNTHNKHPTWYYIPYGLIARLFLVEETAGNTGESEPFILLLHHCSCDFHWECPILEQLFLQSYVFI